MSIGKKLKEARMVKAYTQEEVAQKLYVTRQTISRWEQEKSTPNIHVLKELSDLYDISLDSLFIAVGQASNENNNTNETKSNIQIETTKEEEKTMKKINPFALIGMIFFNICLALAVFLTALGLLFALWSITLSFILSPVLVVGASFFLNVFDKFPWDQALISLVFCAVGVILWPLSKKATSYLFKFFLNYAKFNMKAIYY